MFLEDQLGNGQRPKGLLYEEKTTDTGLNLGSKVNREYKNDGSILAKAHGIG